MNFRTLFYSVGCLTLCLHAALLCESLPHQDQLTQDSFTQTHSSLYLDEHDKQKEAVIPTALTLQPVETELLSPATTIHDDVFEVVQQTTTESHPESEPETPEDIPVTSTTIADNASELLKQADTQNAVPTLPDMQSTSNNNFDDLLALLASEQSHITKIEDTTTPSHIPVQKTHTATQAQPAPKTTPSAAEQKKAQLLTAIENRSKKNQSGIRKSPLFNLTSRSQQTSPQFTMPHQPGALEQLLTGTFYTLLSAIVGGLATQHGSDFISNWWSRRSLQAEDVTQTNIEKSNISAIITNDTKNIQSLEEIIDFIVGQTIKRWNWKHKNPHTPYPEEIAIHPSKPFYAIQFKGSAGAGKSYLNRIMYGEIHKRLLNSTELEEGVPPHKGVKFLELTLQSFTSKWVGEGEKKLKQVFEFAQAADKEGYLAALFFDEVHALNGDSQNNNKSSHNSDIIQQFKSCITNGKYTTGIMISSATDQDIIDKAIERRLGTWYYVNDFKKEDYGSYLLSLLTKKWSHYPGLTLQFANQACTKLPNKVPMDVLYRLSEVMHQSMHSHNGDLQKTLHTANVFSENITKQLQHNTDAIKALNLAPGLWGKVKLMWHYWKSHYKDPRQVASALSNPLTATPAAVTLLLTTAVEPTIGKTVNTLGENAENTIRNLSTPMHNTWGTIKHYFNSPDNQN